MTFSLLLLLVACDATNPARTAIEQKKAPPVEQVAEDTWTCPMHPEIRTHEPGICPKCSMDLIKVQPRKEAP